MSGRLLVTGGSGYLGGELLRLASGPVLATFLDADPPTAGHAGWLRLDVRDQASVDAAFGHFAPDAVIHTAYRQEGPEAHEVNVRGSANVAAAAARSGARLLHVSTDVVFGGAKDGAYTEQDEPDPRTDYGRSKLAAEREVLAADPAALVVRPSLMVGGPEPGRQERAVIAAARGEASTRFFEDELRTPLLVEDLAMALLELAGGAETGLLHVGGPETLSRYELARRVASARGQDPERLRAGSLAASGLDRPANCALDSSRALSVLRTRLRSVGTLASGQRRP